MVAFHEDIQKEQGHNATKYTGSREAKREETTVVQITSQTTWGMDSYGLPKTYTAASPGLGRTQDRAIALQTLQVWTLSYHYGLEDNAVGRVD